MKKNKIEELKEKLYRAIENHGRDSPEVLEISQKLDLYIVEKIRKDYIYNEGKLRHGILKDK